MEFPWVHAVFIAGALGLMLFQFRGYLADIFGRSIGDTTDIIEDSEQQSLWDMLQPVLDEAEVKRQSMVKVFIVLALLMTVTIVLYSIHIVPHLLSMRGENSSQSVLLGYLAQLVIPYIPVYLYKKHYKKNVIPIVAERIDYRYDFKGRTAWTLLRQVEGNWAGLSGKKGQVSPMFGHYTSSRHEDGFMGSYRSKTVAFEEIKLTRGSGKNKSTVFKGLLMAVDAPRPAEVPVILRRDAGSNLLRYLYSFGLDNGMEQITLEDIRFEKEFDVYSSDQIKARRVLTPHFMEQLVGISEFYQSPVMASFYGDKVFIAVRTGRNFFEPASFFIDARSRRNVALIIAQIKLQHQVIDSLE